MIKELAYAWIVVTIGTGLDLLYQLVFTESVNYINALGFWGSITGMIAILSVILLESEKRQEKKNKVSKLEQRVQKLESQLKQEEN